MHTYLNLAVEDLTLSDGGSTARQVTIHRDRALNALDSATLRELKVAVSTTPPSARVMVLAGAGDKAFVAGADISEMADFGPQEAIAFSRLGYEVMRGLEALPIPVIAAVNGYCLGGGIELALSCDFIVASSRAVFGLPEAIVGVIPGFGGLRKLARRVGLPLASQMAFTGGRLTAEEALAKGIVNEVVEAEALHSHVLDLCEKISKHAPLAISEAKSALRYDPQDSEARYAERERAAFGRLFATSDQKEGMRAFLEKREPKWTSS